MLRPHAVQAKNIERIAFNCAIRNSEELLTEQIELHLGEDLVTEVDGCECPLIRINELGAWAYMPQQNIWWPLRNHRPQLGLDGRGNVRIRWNE